MRFIPIELHIERWDTFQIYLLHFDWPEGDTSFINIGWYQEKFQFDILFWWAFRWKLLPKFAEWFD
jgi:hypothetical protein